jgi:hypothetical protein
MADAPELPEAKDGYERTIALIIAIMAVMLSFVENTGDNAKTDAIVKTSKAANQWAYFQSKSLKENLAETNALLLSQLTSVDPAATKAKQAEMEAEVKRYDGEKKEIMNAAKALEAEVDYAMSVDDRCDLASLFLQIAIVICSIAILVRWKAIFFVGVVLSLVGAVISVTAFMM